MIETKKYILTDETKEHFVVDGTISKGGKIVTLHRIKAVSDIWNWNHTKILVHTGEKGGWVQSEENLSQTGSCWIYDNGIVCQKAKIEDCAIVSGNAVVEGFAEVYGRARVQDFAYVYGCPEIYENAVIKGCATVFDASEIRGCAEISGYAKVCEYAEISGDALVTKNAQIGGHRRINEGIYEGRPSRKIDDGKGGL